MAAVTERGGLAQNPEPAGEPEVINVRDLRMRYGSVDVLEGIDFTATRGEGTGRCCGPRPRRSVWSGTSPAR